MSLANRSKVKISLAQQSYIQTKISIALSRGAQTSEAKHSIVISNRGLVKRSKER